MANAVTTFETWLTRVLRVICATLFAVLVALVTWQVFTRLVLGAPSPWTEEAARYAFVWVSLIGIAIAVAEKADVVMEFVVERLPKALQRVADVLAYLSTLSFVVYAMIIGGFELVDLAWGQRNPLLPLTQGQLYLVIPISGILLALFLVLHLGRTLAPGYAGREGFHEDPAAAGA
ncbi:TRAP transporter small permease [Agrococcus jejuensis]|uniref:TRAP-type C4-dicarboxylate transport system, small permease component n=1 Tax=Agrococcus jejuensis TaxID=399736 RepID=A0A1G8CD71_9MICO|nr:TRAP transporter small permease [Agrococcus jejuensis]SDH43299.1 TRAP-type C4-dicarboxylate transport system, small permease component [Agrococcus jejuensis]